MDGEIGENFSITQDGVLTMRGGACVPDVDNLRKLIMEETHYSTYAMHARSTKMYYTIKKNYWWSDMKRDIADFVVRYLVLSTSEGRTSETFRNSSASAYS